ncbi:hypothetical protein Ahy_B09g099455 isoform A [Arachis hypogaea]|uniref:Uncharacterized protein n=1 Tax=Arachis hypogaea TaxID=3818 RepID=A0A444XUP5_ARAHY|nr:hypothetical protein Ahy_B09g099455 isoform A [Arachis hypogaea]
MAVFTWVSRRSTAICWQLANRNTTQMIMLSLLPPYFPICGLYLGKWRLSIWFKATELKEQKCLIINKLNILAVIITTFTVRCIPEPGNCINKSLTFVIPLPLPTTVTAPPRDTDFFIPLPGPARTPLWDIPGSSPSHRISLGDI